MRPVSPALLERLWAPDPSARPVIEAVALSLSAAGQPQQDSRYRPDQWQLADSVAGLEIDAFGGVRLADTTVDWIHSLTSNQFLTDLDGPISFPAASPYFAAHLHWGADGSPDLVIDRVTANLHPQVNPATPKTVDTWYCQLFAIHGTTDFAIGGTPYELLAGLVPLGPAIGVKALGNAQGDVVFSWVGQPVKPRPKSVPSNTKMSRGTEAFTPWPRTLIVIWAVQANGAPATNVGWAVDSTLTFLTQGSRTLRGVGFADLGTALGGPAGSAPGRYLADVLGVSAAQPVPRLTIETGSYVAGKIQFSGGGNQFTLPQIPTQTVEFQGEADVPSGASCIFEVLKNGGNPANDPDWLPFTDGMTSDDPSFGGLVSKRTTYQLRARLLPPAAGDTSPTVRALGVREVTITDASRVAQLTGVRWAVDPVTLKAEIPQAQLVALRDGDRDFQDLFAQILSQNDLANVSIRVWIGDSALPRGQWAHPDDFLIEDPDDGGAVFSLTLLSTLTLLRGAIPQYTPAVLAPPTADLANPGGFTNEAGGASLWDHINETLPDDTTYAQSPLHPAAAEWEVSVQPMADPHLSTCHEVDLRYGKDVAGGDNIDITVQLREGATIRASQLFQNVGPGFVLGKLVLTAAQADAIVDYTNLRLHFIANVNGGGGGNRRGRISYAQFQITARRTPVVYNNQSLHDVAQDLLENQIELPARYQGLGVADTTTLVSKVITDSDAKNELDAVAFAAGMAYISSQGRIKAVDLMGGTWSPDPTPAWVFNPTAIAAVIPGDELEPLGATPGFRQRVPEFFAKWGWDADAGQYTGEARGFNASALAALGIAQLDPPQTLDDVIAQYLQTDVQAQALAQRQVQALGAGMILFRFRSTYPQIMLELGDTIAFQTDRFAAKDPSSARAVRGALWVVGKVVEINDLYHRELGVWVRSYADLLAAAEAATRIGFAAPAVLSVAPTVDSSGNVNVAIAAANAKSIRLAASTAGPPARATIAAAAPLALTADGLLTANAVLTPLLAGQTCYVGVLAYENADGTGSESADIALGTVAAPATPWNGLLGIQLSWKASHLFVNVEGGPGVLSFKIATSTVGYPAAGTGTVTNGTSGNVDVGGFTYGQTVYVTVTPYAAVGGGGAAGAAKGGESTLPFGDGVFDLPGGHMLRSASLDDGKFALRASKSDGSTAVSDAMNPQGSVPPITSDANPLSYSSWCVAVGTRAGVRWTWSAFTIYRADGSTISVAASTTLPTTAAPTLAQVAGGALAARTRCVRIALVKDKLMFGISAESALAVGANNLLKVTSPASVAGYDGWIPLVGDVNLNNEVLQTGAGGALPAAPIAFGTDWTEPAAGAVVPTGANTQFNDDATPLGAHDWNLAAGGTYWYYPCYDVTNGRMSFAGGGGMTAKSNLQASRQNRDGYIPLAVQGPIFASTPAIGAGGGGSGGGGCLHPDTEVETPDGVRRLATLAEGDRLRGRSGAWTRVTRLARRPQESWIRVRAATGAMLLVTRSHPFTCALGVRRAQTLALGDLVYVPGGLAELVALEAVQLTGVDQVDVECAPEREFWASAPGTPRLLTHNTYVNS